MRFSKHWTLRCASAFIVLGPALLCGCARERVSVTLGKDGTWTRKAVYVVANLDGGGKPEAGKTSEVSDSFVLPSGEGWKLTSEKNKDEKRVIAERTLPLDQTITNDIVVKEMPKLALPPGQIPGGKEGAILIHAEAPQGPLKTLTTNSVTVRQVSPGKYLYTETLQWTGDMPSNTQKFDEKETALVKAALPAELATEENVKAVTEVFSKTFALALIGPPTPLIHRLPMLMSAPEVFARLVSRRVGPALLPALKEKFGDRMTAEQRLAVTRSLVQGITDELKVNGPDQAGNAQEGDSNKNSTGISLFVSVKLPGRVVATNGTVDNFSHEISWSFYPEAAAFGEVKLTALCDTTGNPVSR